MTYKGTGIWEAYLEWDSVNESTISWASDYEGIAYNENKNMLFTFSISLDISLTNFEAEFGFYDPAFRITGGKLQTNLYGVSSPGWEDVADVDPLDPLILRWYFDAEKQHHYFFVNGQQVRDFTNPRTPQEFGGEGPYMITNVTGTNDGRLFFANGLIARQR